MTETNGPANRTLKAPYSLWTHNNSPEWLEQNAGVPLVLLIPTMGESAALMTARRLVENYGDQCVEVWDNSNRIVWATDPALIGTSGNWRDRDNVAAAELQAEIDSDA
jgi:hypothetical protein